MPWMSRFRLARLLWFRTRPHKRHSFKIRIKSRKKIRERCHRRPSMLKNLSKRKIKCLGRLHSSKTSLRSWISPGISNHFINNNRSSNYKFHNNKINYNFNNSSTCRFNNLIEKIARPSKMDTGTCNIALKSQKNLSKSSKTLQILQTVAQWPIKTPILKKEISYCSKWFIQTWIEATSPSA